MRTMFDWSRCAAARFAGAPARDLGRVWLMLAAIVIGSGRVEAQVSPEFAEFNLAPAAEEMAAAGVDGSLETLGTLLEIAQRYGFGYGISPDEARQLVGGYLAVRQIDCRSLDEKYEAAMRLSRALSGIAWLYAAGAGLTYAAPPVAAALGLGALISGIGATAASWLASEYRAHRSRVRCTKEGSIEWFRPAARDIQAAVDPVLWRFSWQRSCGASSCA